MRKRVQVRPITAEQLKQKLKKSRLKKRGTVRRAVKFTSDSWYSGAMLSIGVSSKIESNTL